MKNEDRIVEILADSLKKQDQQTELLNQQTELLNILVQGQAQLLLTAKETNGRLASMEKNLAEISELRREIEKIKKHIGMD